MKAKDGNIYFISEKDFFTGEASAYYKVGLVRNDRESSERKKDHQTGNPRELKVEEEIATAAVNDLESTLHDRFALSRVSGEWFRFNPQSLADAREIARQLAAETLDLREVLAGAEELSGVISDTTVAPASSEISDMHRELVLVRNRAKSVTGLQKHAEKELKSLAVGFQEIDSVCSLRETSVRRTFNRVAFEAEMPALAVQYTTKKDVRGIFRPSMPSAPRQRKNSELEEEAVEELLSEAAGTKNRDHRAELLHLAFLESLSDLAIVKWRQDVLTHRIQVACGSADGIDGVCTWKREEKVSLDTELLKFKEPEIYELFMRESTPNRTFIVNPFRQYRY